MLEVRKLGIPSTVGHFDLPLEFRLSSVTALE